MNGQQIHQALKSNGITYTDIAKASGVAISTVSLVANGKSSSRRVALALAAALDKPIETVFPDRPHYHKQADPAERERRLAAVRDAVSAAA